MAEEHSYTDVLIIGAGPAGRMLAACLARQDVKTRIIEKRRTRVLNGQADGVNSRSLEIFQSLGILTNVLENSATLPGKCAWSPNKDGVLARSAFRYHNDGVFAHREMRGRSQGRTEKDLEDAIVRYSDMRIEYAVAPTQLQIDPQTAEDEDAYPVQVSLRQLREHESQPFQLRSHTKNLGEPPSAESSKASSFAVDLKFGDESDEVVHAKYVVGCDGAWSQTRKHLGIEMVGESTDDYWAVIDIIPVTDFPDARHCCMIQSAVGSALWIPREHGLVRIYTQLDVHLDENGEFDRSSVTAAQVLSDAQKILRPYKLDYMFCDWWTVYRVGQRVGSAFNDASLRVFLTGDAVHTHSPKVGLGMNTSMADSWNLAWKLAAVINKESPRTILRTYESERRPVAQNLIHFDSFISRVFGGKPSPDELRAADKAGSDFTAGTQITYATSEVIASLKEVNGSKMKRQSVTEVNNHDAAAKYIIPDPVEPLSHPLAAKLQIGQRLPPYQIQNQASLLNTEILEVLPADGRWRLIVFAGNLADGSQLERVNKLGQGLAEPADSILRRYTHVVCLPVERPFEYTAHLPDMGLIQPHKRRVPTVDVLTVHSSESDKAQLFALHPAFIPSDEVTGRDHDKVFVNMGIYDAYGIDVEGPGCMVLSRPDQHVAWVGGLNDLDHLDHFLNGCLLENKS